MKGKIFVLILVLVFLFASGCTGKDAGPAPKDSNTSMPEAGMAEQKENETSGSGEDHIVRLVYPYNIMRPSELDIKTGDTVSWRSDKKQKPDYTLVSKEGLFPDKEVAYSVPYTYTFNNPGNYLFTVKDIPGMNVTIRVK
jgi:plastocyanin